MKGQLLKLNIKDSGIASYQMQVAQQLIDLNQQVGKQISFSFQGEIICSVCHDLTPKSYQGCCYRCFTLLARNDRCVLNPHLCHFAKGTCREPAWGMTHCMQPHYVYLAWTSGLKVGITKSGNVPTRWLDQGALSAKVLCTAPSRYCAGVIENYLHEWYEDRTQWQTMLKMHQAPSELDLEAACERARALIGANQEIEWLDQLVFMDDAVRALTYPMPSSVEALKSLSFDRTPKISGQLLGMKGQYLYLDCGVLNIRKHTGYVVNVSLD